MGKEILNFVNAAIWPAIHYRCSYFTFNGEPELAYVRCASVAGTA